MTEEQKDTTKVIRFPIPVMAILGFVFIYLKVQGLVDWAWLWVLAPFWLPFGIGLSFLGIFLVIAVLGAIVAAFASSRRY